MKKYLNKIKKNIKKIIFKEKFPVHPFGMQPRASKENYLELFKEAKNINYPEIDQFENKYGFSIDKEWLDNLALHTQIVIKESKLNYQHGRLLYTILRKYIADNMEDTNKFGVNVFETGTARGFSSICMAKALIDSKTNGSIITIDQIPHNKPMLWNCIDDHDGFKSREKLLEKWSDELRYITFIQGWTKLQLERLGINRINIAFLDAEHTFEDLLYEYNYVKERQNRGDIIVFDDVTPGLFDGIVNAINFIEKEELYIIEKLTVSDQRGYAIGNHK